MKITFHIDYRTEWGEALYLWGAVPALGDGDLSKAVKMTLLGAESWSVIIELPDDTKNFEYGYIVRHENGTIKKEWGTPHRFLYGHKIRSYQMFDRWQDEPWDKSYYSAVFTDCICGRKDPQRVCHPIPGQVQFRVSAPLLGKDEVIAISGSCDALGNWDPEKAVVMSDALYPEWVANVPLEEVMATEVNDSTTIQYKFVKLKASTKEISEWEGGENRSLLVPSLSSEGTAVYSGMRFINNGILWKGAGVAIPVFALRTNEDFGVGDFYDLKKMVDWAEVTGQRIIQILPINDTTMTHTWTDSYPYNANSPFALHPMYLRPSALGILHDQAKMDRFNAIAAELNALEQIDYEKVNNTKRDYYWALFDQEGEATLNSEDYQKFYQKNQGWLKPYAAFCILRDKTGSCEFKDWGEYEKYDPAKVEILIENNRKEYNFNCYLQYHLDKQLNEVCRYAHDHGVAIKGDIPIGISRNSVDAWTEPQLLNLDSQAGAPPDDFSVLGQNWGFPTYNWDEMAKDGYKWWEKRFGKMSEYCDAYRIDHVLGFFRIWQIPMTQLHGLLGIFNPALPFTPDELKQNYDFWIDPEIQAKPYIMDYFLGDFFGEYTDEVKEKYLIPLDHGRYRMKDEFDNQRKIVEYFATQEKNQKNSRICNALMGLIDEVLFIEDPKEKGKYHPRISAQFTYSYRALSDYEKWCYNRLYNDFFYHRHNDFWYHKAMSKLPPLIDSTNMLCCAEDLGMIPDCVPAVMGKLQILSLEIQRMPKDPKVKWGNTWSYPYLSVCTTSTHDMGGIRQWWEENHATNQEFFNQVLHMNGEAPYYAEPWLCDKIVDLNLKSPSMLCILPLQDWLSIDGALRRTNPFEEQINVPANSRHYWRYRMHLTMENLLGADVFNQTVLTRVRESGR